MTHIISLIGSGPTTIGFLLELLALIESQKISDEQAQQLVINIFEESSLLGAGAPYDLTKTGFQHISNIRNNSGTLPQSGADFMQWISANKDFIEQVFNKIFAQRLNEKISKQPDKEATFRQSYEAIKANFKERYLNLNDSQRTYHPRILYGIYRVALFEKIVGLLEEKGVVINQYAKTKVVDFAQNPNQKFTLTFENITGESSTESDFVLLASGMAEKLPEIVDENFLPSQWPESLLIAQVEKMVDKAKKSNLPQIEIGILGSSLSAIEAVRTIFYERIFQGKADFELNGVAVKIDLISRSGLLPKVRAAYAPFDYKKQGGKFPEISILQEARDLKEQEGEIHLWQILQMCAQKTEVFYRYFGHEAQAMEARRIAKFVGEAKENYPAILQEFAKLESPNSFKQLEIDIKKAKEGDMGKLLGHQVAYGLIGMANPEILKLLNQEDRNLYDEFFSTLHNLQDSPMPIPVAEELLGLHKAGLVNVVRMGYQKSGVKAQGSRFTITDENGATHTYGALVRADGYVKELEKSGDKLHQKIAEQENNERVFAPYQAGIGVLAAQNFGGEVAGKIMTIISGKKITPAANLEVRVTEKPKGVIQHFEGRSLSESAAKQATQG